MNLEPAFYWLIAGIVLMIIELLLTGVFFIYLAIGCIGGMVADWLGFGLTGQIFGFTIAILIGLLFFRRFFNRTFFLTGGEKTNTDALIGRKAIVTETVSDQGGRVLLGGEHWRAVSDMMHAEGSAVMVTAVSGATVRVAQLPEN
ncbi:NfeD family protein [Cerasicoccus maritimus]|uniref:NfeD family protein n=1 Tax=Cerasicoccus maritimus TaxID=490089 RepID=UPI0028529CC7|nr:NfeD family protein [Cerasicoccus maritimus]